MKNIPQLLDEIHALLGNEILTPKTKTTSVRFYLSLLGGVFTVLKRTIQALYTGLHEGFTDHDEMGFEFCPLCDHARSKGHASVCPWAILEDVLGGDLYHV